MPRRSDETARLVPEPVIVIEVASPSTRLADVNDKVEFYGGIVSVQHYLVVEQDRRRVVCHGRGQSGGLAHRILRDGEIALDPPGIRLALTLCIRTRSSPRSDLDPAAAQPRSGFG